MAHLPLVRLLLFLLFLLFLLSGLPGAARAEPPTATLSLLVNQPRGEVRMSLLVVGGARPAPERQVREAMGLALGGPPSAFTYDDLTAAVEGGAADGGGDAGTLRRAAPRTVVAWKAVAATRGPASDFSRRWLVTGRLDPKPLADLLRPLGIPRVEAGALLTGRDAAVTAFRGGVPGGETSSAFRNAGVFHADFDTANPPPPFAFEVGYRPSDLARAFGPLLALLALPVGLTLWFRGRALRAQEQAARELAERGGEETEEQAEDREERLASIWFGYFRLLNQGMLVFGLVWFAAVFALDPIKALRYGFDIRTSEGRTLVSFLSFTLPPALVSMGCVLLSRPVFARLRDTEMSVADVVLQTGGQFALQIVPTMLFFLGLNALLDGRTLPLLQAHGVTRDSFALLLQSPSFRRGLAWLALAAVSRGLIQQWLVLAQKTPPLVLTDGPLRDRVLELARAASVVVKHVLYLPTGRQRMANAFAAGGNLVLFTDRLLGEMSRREVDGVIAHELAHLKFRHPFWKGVIHVVAVALPLGGLVLLQLLLRPSPALSQRVMLVAVPLLVAFVVFLELYVSRRWERAADLQAARLTGDGEGLALGLARLARLNGVPREWGRWEGSLLTHPANARRVAYLNEAGLLTPGQMDDLRERDRRKLVTPPPDERYLVAFEAEDAVYTPQTRLRHTVGSSFLYVLLFATAPLPGLLIAEWLGARLGVTALVAGYAATALGLLVLYLRLADRRALSLYGPLEARLRQKFVREGVLPEDPSATAYVALAPGGPLRLFYGKPDIDLGFLVVEPDRLRFVGESIRFALRREQIAEIALAAPWPGLLPTRALELRWPDPDAEGRVTDRTTVVFRLASARTLAEHRRRIPVLRDQLREWQAQPLPALPPPAEPGPTPFISPPGGDPLRNLLKPALMWAAFRPLGLSALAAGFLSGLPLRAPLFMAGLVLALLAAEWVQIRRAVNAQP